MAPTKSRRARALSADSAPQDATESIGTSEPAAPAVGPAGFVWVAGFHHSGTSLVHLILAAAGGVAVLQHTHKPENEGQHLLGGNRSVWPPYNSRRRDVRAVQPVALPPGL